MQDLTDVQKALYKAIKEYIEEYHYSPTIRELVQITGKKSTGTTAATLKILKRKGYIDYNYNRNRTIRILKEIVDER